PYPTIRPAALRSVGLHPPLPSPLFPYTTLFRSFLVEWTSRNFKKISPFLIAIGGAYYAFKALSPDAGNMEQRFIGNLTFIFPFIVALCNFVYIYCCGIFFRGYYVSKYSEEFREKHGYTKKEWYGPKYKDNQAS